MKEVKKETRNKNFKVGIYIRVTEEEKALQGYSIAVQKDILNKYCKVKNWDIYNIYIDEGISAKNMKDRPQMQNLLSDIKEENINIVLAIKLDSLTTSMKDLNNFVDLINKKNCAFISTIDMIDTRTLPGRMYFQIIKGFYEFERENIRKSKNSNYQNNGRC